jgi:putative transposase
MHYDPDKHHRRSIRLKGYDYTSSGAYFVTICAQGRECALGEVSDGKMMLNDWGEAVAETWLWLADQYAYVTLDSWIVTPNHLHGIVVMQGGKEPPSKHKPLGRLVGAFKTVSTRRINELRAHPGASFWQRNYWEHIIRNDEHLNGIRDYIHTNPARWAEDQLHPDAAPNRFNHMRSL